MTSGLVLLFLAMATASMAIVLMVRELHLRALNTRASNVVTGVSERPAARFKEVTGWLSSIGMRYRRFYSAEDLEQLRAVIQSSGFNPHRALPIWIGVKIVSMVLVPLVALFIAEFLGEPLTDLLILALLGLALGIMGPRWILAALRWRFAAAVRRGAPDAIDLLVVCSEAGMGLETALDRVAEEMRLTNPAMAQVLFSLLDDLRILPNRRDAFEKLGSTADGMRRFGAVISQSLQLGTPLSQALRSIAEELRRDSLIKLEDRAHKLGAKLTIPMVLFMLPAMFIVLGGGPFLNLIHAFRGAGQ